MSYSGSTRKGLEIFLYGIIYLYFRINIHTENLKFLNLRLLMKTERLEVTINELLCSETFFVIFNRKYSLLKVDQIY